MEQLIQRINKLSLPGKVGIAAGAVIMIVALSYFLFIQATHEEIAALQAQQQAADASLTEKQAIADNLNAKRREMDALNQRLQDALTQLPDQKDIEDVLTQFNEIGRRSGLEIQSVVPGTERAASFYAEIPIAVAVAGNYQEIAVFLQEVSRLKRIVNVSDIKMGTPTQPKDKVVLKCSFIATTFRFLETKANAPGKGAAL